MTDPVPLATTLARWGLGLRDRDVPASARSTAVRHLLDGVGTAVGAARRGAADPAIRVALDLAGPEEATVLGEPRRISAPAAALANGTLLHALDFDDTHAGGLVHATAMVLPAAFAVGEQVDATGAEVLLAALAGYEVACRLAAAAPHGFHAKGLHATAVCGVFASALVASRLMGLDEATCVNALGIAGSQSGGLLEFLATGASTKQLHPGISGQAGILAARLAAAGATGPATVLDGRNGLYAALLGRRIDPALVSDGLGVRWEVEKITVKPYPACQLMHVALDAARVAMESARAGGAAGRTVADLVEVVAVVHPDSATIVCEPRAAKIAPRTAYDAKFSLPWSVAALLVDGDLGLASYDGQSIIRPEVVALAGKVTARTEDAGTVAADAPGLVELRFTDGTIVTGKVARSIGGPEQPLDDAALDAKFLSNCQDVPGAVGVARRFRGLADEPSIKSLVAAASAIAVREVHR